MLQELKKLTANKKLILALEMKVKNEKLRETIMTLVINIVTEVCYKFFKFM